MYMHNNDIYKYMRYKSYNDVYIYIYAKMQVYIEAASYYL